MKITILDEKAISWNIEEISYLINNYRSSNLPEIARYLKRGRIATALKASRLGLTYKRGTKGKPISDLHRKNFSIAQKIIGQRPEIKKMRSKQARESIKKYGHPKGMLGKHHTQETKNRIRERQIGVNKWTPAKLKMREINLMAKYGKLSFNTSNSYSRTQKGWMDFDNDKRYFMKSKWEMNYGLYLDWLKSKKQIKDWLYEADTFWFNKIRRGVRSYLPDFKIINKDNSFEYHEIKGWMDNKSKTKIKRMGIYYPKIKLIIIGEDEYKALKKMERVFKWI